MKVTYNFYKEYSNLEENFLLIMNKRIEDIKNEYKLKKEKDKIIKEYFVEIFSWSVLPYSSLKEISEIVKKNKCDIILDPCCGNSFHTYLFETFMGIKCLTFDIQSQSNSWTNIIEKNGLNILDNISNHTNICLLLSWLDYEELGIKLLEKYNGNLIISIGNYEELSPNYLNKLKKVYNLVKKIRLDMPWGLTENIEIYLLKQ